MIAPPPTSAAGGRGRILITGGCGFIGSNLAAALAARGRDVLILDNLSRAGTERNAEWLRAQFRDRVTIALADVRDADSVRSAVLQADGVLHLAAQVAVTSSLDDPLEDFEINARGTLTLLESVRRYNPAAPVIFASTNKVYGRLLGEADYARQGDRYTPFGPQFRHGVAEETPLDLFSPYGCSKGAADQYVHDYARVFGLRTVVLRMGCIYGPRQFGTEDQGWIAHFILQAIRGQPITIYGDGYQVRDALYVDDAVAAWLKALDNIDAVSGRVFNLGGGPDNALSLHNLIDFITDLRGVSPGLDFGKWRHGDQPWYISDIRAIGRALDWSPQVPLRQGLQKLARWLDRHHGEMVRTAPLQEASA